jgi:ribosomal protein S8
LLASNSSIFWLIKFLNYCFLSLSTYFSSLTGIFSPNSRVRAAILSTAALISATKLIKSASHSSYNAKMRSSSNLYSSLKSSSADYNNLIKSSTGPSASNYKAMVANKVLPYLLYSILSTVVYTSDSVMAQAEATRHVIAIIANTLIRFLIIFMFLPINVEQHARFPRRKAVTFDSSHTPRQLGGTLKLIEE